MNNKIFDKNAKLFCTGNLEVLSKGIEITDEVEIGDLIATTDGKTFTKATAVGNLYGVVYSVDIKDEDMGETVNHAVVLTHGEVARIGINFDTMDETEVEKELRPLGIYIA